MSTPSSTLPPVLMPSGPLIDPANWRGPDMRKRSDWLYHLEPEEIAALETAERKVAATGKELAAVTRQDFDLGVFAPKIAAIKRQLIDGLGCVLIRGLPVQRYTPQQAATIYWGINLHLGKAVPANMYGHLLSHVINRGETMANVKQGGSYTNETLNFHVDESDFVALLCLQPAKSGGASMISSAVAIHNHIQAERPDLLELLYQPWYIDRRGNATPAGAKPWYLMPVFTLVNNKLMVWVQPSYTASSQRFPEVPRYTDKHWEAFQMIQELSNDPRFRLDMDFNTGDIQVLNNHVILHSRTAYEDFPDRKRHLLRIMTVDPSARVLSPWHTGPDARTPGSRFEVFLGDTPRSVPVELD